MRRSKNHNSLLLFLGLWTILCFNQVRGGEKWKIRHVHFSGNTAFSEKRLHKVILSRPSGFLNPIWYRPEILAEDLRQLALFYHANGYLEANILSSAVQMDSTEGKVDVRITLYEGDQIRISEIGVIGNVHFSTYDILNSLPIKSGDPFLKKQTESSLLILLRKYAQAGFIGADVRPDIFVDSTAHLAMIRFKIQEGHRCRIDSIAIHGLRRTRESVVRRECQFQTGDWIQYSRLLATQRNLYLTGLFRSVYVRPGGVHGDDSSLVSVHIEIQENDAAEFLVAGGYGSLDKLRGRAEFNHQNLQGTARKLGLKLQVSFIHRSAEIAFTEPWAFGKRWRTDMTMRIEQQEQPGFDYTRHGGRILVGHPFSEFLDYKMAYRVDRTKLKNIRTSQIPAELRNDIRSFTVSLAFDTRDNLFNSSRGVFVEWSHELGRVFTEVDDGFYRTILMMKGFLPVTPGTIVGSGVELGWMTVAGGISRIPLQERFYAGGPNSIRGFRYQHVGPLDTNGFPEGGQAKVVWHVCELRRTVYRMIGAAVFYDLGGIWEHPKTVTWKSVQSAFGGGLRISTPFGVARLDLGVNLNPSPFEPKTQWHFSMGQAF